LKLGFPSFSREKNTHHYIIDSFLVSISREIWINKHISGGFSSGGMKYHEPGAFTFALPWYCGISSVKFVAVYGFVQLWFYTLL